VFIAPASRERARFACSPPGGLAAFASFGIAIWAGPLNPRFRRRETSRRSYCNASSLGGDGMSWIVSAISISLSGSLIGVLATSGSLRSRASDHLVWLTARSASLVMVLQAPCRLLTIPRSWLSWDFCRSQGRPDQSSPRRGITGLPAKLPSRRYRIRDFADAGAYHVGADILFCAALWISLLLASGRAIYATGGMPKPPRCLCVCRAAHGGDVVAAANGLFAGSRRCYSRPTQG